MLTAADISFSPRLLLMLLYYATRESVVATAAGVTRVADGAMLRASVSAVANIAE